MTTLTAFSAMYLLISGFSLAMGYYTLSINIKSRINKLFFVVNLLMAVWALGLSVVILAPDEHAAALWTRIAATGYCMFYGVLLHFAFALTGADKVLRKWWTYLLIYAPAFICLYGLVISPYITTSIYHFQQTAGGWARTTPPTLFDTIFEIYFILFVLISLTLILLWRRRSQAPSVKKQSALLLGSIAIAVCLGTVTDIANGIYFSLPIPKIAPLLFLIPLGTIFYCINRYELMKAPTPQSMELILTDNHRQSVFLLSSVGLIAGGIILLVMEFSWWQQANPLFIALAGVFPIVMGAVLIRAQKKQKNEKFLESVLALSSLVVIPTIMAEVSGTGGTTVWAVPIVILICSLVFNLHLVLFSAMATMLLGQLYVWGVSPEVHIGINSSSYLARLAISLFIIAAAYYVHYIYRSKLRENSERAKTQDLLTKLSSAFDGINADNALIKKREMLCTLADFYGASRVFADTLEPLYASFMPQLAFSTDGSALPPDYQDICRARWRAYLAAGGLEDSMSGRTDTTALDTPWLFIPVFADERPVGYMQFETDNPKKVWTAGQRITVQVVSRISTGALEKASGESRIRYMAFYDSLTGLPNRELFYDRAEQAVRAARRTGTIMGIVFLDLDSFKSVNDTLGHEGGDTLIKAIGDKLSSCLRSSDTVARFGGDEFLVLLSNVKTLEDITAIADKLMQQFKEPVIIRDQEMFITASAGISVFPADGDDAQALIKHADIAMYSAKEKGKNQYVLCSAHMKERMHYKITLSNQLYRALDNHELAVYYQPQVSLQTGKIVGVEALLRWFNPRLGMISPGDFIPLAEQTGLITPIGLWVLRTACAQSMVWKNLGFTGIRMAVNLSVVQLRNSNLVSQTRRVIQDTGIDPGLLELEITESATIREPDYIVGVLNDLKALGLSISIDDFGTEYSSLNRLKTLPIDRLKMDIQFVHGIDKSPKDQAITMVIINLAKNLELQLVAEGVESSTQLDFLKQRMCDEVQGFYYYKPMPPEEIEKILLSVPVE